MAVNVVDKIDDLVRIRHALVSVSDKRNLDQFLPQLIGICPDITVYSTGGTYQSIEKILGDKASKALVQVSSYTGQPETQGGLVKTLDFKIYLGLLTETYNSAHQEDLARTGAVPIDLVVVNLYPFEATVAKDGTTLEEARANVDIGGPCMIRAGAKNYLRVAVLVDPGEYGPFLTSLTANQGCTTLHQRFELATKAFRHTAAYDHAIGGYLSKVIFDKASKCYRIQTR